LTATAARDRRNPDRPDTHTVVALLHQPADARIHDQLPPLFATEATQRISFGFSRVGGRWWSTPKSTTDLTNRDVGPHELGAGD